MSKNIKYIIYAVVTLAVIVVGAFAGKIIAVNTAPPKPLSSAIEETTLPIEQNFESLEAADYIAAQPTSGILVFTQGVDVTFDEENDVATGFLDEQSMSQVQMNQKVVLYDKESVTLPLGGSVTAINKEDGKYKVYIKLPEYTDESLLMPFVNIITDMPDVAGRMPLSALQKEDDGLEYVWVMRKTDKPDKFRAEKVFVESGMANNEYFTVTTFFNPDEKVIVNPDKNLKAEKLYNIAVADLGAPTVDPIRQAWIDFEIRRLDELAKEMTALFTRCMQGEDRGYKGAITLPSGKNVDVTCDTFQGQPDARSAIQTLLKNEKGSSCGSCGGQ